jgi:CelD/BcsL family acetyltransferase involved in cellulose biosynthesis
MLNRMTAHAHTLALEPALKEDPGSAPSCHGRPEPVVQRICRDRGPHDFTEGLAQWQKLEGGRSPLLAPELSLLTVGLLREGEPLLVGARRGEALVAALPVVRRGRTLVALRCDHTPRVDLVGDAATLPAVWRAIRAAGPWDVLRFRGIPADSPLARLVPALARADGFGAHLRETSRAPWFEVHEIEQRVHRRFRGDMRRLERQLGGVELERIAVFDRAALAEFFRLEALGWKGKQGTAIACDPGLMAFYTAIARVFARRQQLTIAFLRARGRRIAGCFALEDAATFHLLKIAHDPEYDHFGPGQLLVRETAADADRRGLSRYDLLGQDTPYKLKWTDKVRPHVEVTIYAPSVRGRARRWAREVVRPRAGRALRAMRGGRGR